MFAHGGGSVPGTLGRIDWGYKCRPDIVATQTAVPPKRSIRNIYVDSITHDPEMLRKLVGVVGVEKIALVK